VEGIAIVTKRIKPLLVNGQTVWTIGIPVHWGFVGVTHSSMANLLTPYVGDANTRCPEFKAFLVNIESTGPAAT
jgi:formate dehydrogenase major subunit